MVDTSSVLHAPYTLRNYWDLVIGSPVFRWFVNSMIVSLGMTLGVLVLSSLAGYGFARLEFPGRDVIFVLVLFGRTYASTGFMGFVVGFVAIVLYTREGLAAVSPTLVRVGRAFNLTPRQEFWKILLPAGMIGAPSRIFCRPPTINCSPGCKPLCTT